MNVKLIDGALVVDLAGADGKALTPADFADKPLTISNEPAFYIALDDKGIMVRNVSVNIADRKNVAALVGNWIAEGFTPVPVDVKGFAKHVRALVAANKPAKGEGQAPADGQADGEGAASGAPKSDI